ncbi:hypothetical protein STEG23_032854 [Scotinomys teguina]
MDTVSTEKVQMANADRNVVSLREEQLCKGSLSQAFLPQHQQDGVLQGRHRASGIIPEEAYLISPPDKRCSPGTPAGARHREDDIAYRIHRKSPAGSGTWKWLASQWNLLASYSEARSILV